MGKLVLKSEGKNTARFVIDDLTLFPLPTERLRIGESVSIPAQMPFNAMGSLLHVAGSSSIKLVNYVEVNGKACAKLDTVISSLNESEFILTRGAE